jgi:transposase InsO family protein
LRAGRTSTAAKEDLDGAWHSAVEHRRPWPRGFVYLAAILDAWSREVVGYALGTTMEATLTLSALEAAFNGRQVLARPDSSFGPR